MDEVSSHLQQQLQQHFGFETFRPGQEAVIAHLLAGQSAAAVFPTGSGKSLCYQLPALLLPGLTLVVSPLIALMKDQIDQLQTRGIAAARLDSSLSLEEYRQVMSDIRAGTLKLLYVAPERFNNERFRHQVEILPISLFAVDEAHCISEWGHNFRPDYLKLVAFAKRCGAERVLALTATAPPKVLDDIRQGFDIAPECAIRTGFYRPNLTLLSTPLRSEDRDGRLVSTLRQRPPGSTIVYVTLQRTAEQVAEQLRTAGFEAQAYHAGMQSEDRSRVQEAFIASDQSIVVATIAFGMGIDKADIRYVYHYNLPKSLENLSQEIGRAGRDGATSICEVLACADDRVVLENFAFGDTPSQEAIARLLRELFVESQEEMLELALVSLGNRCDLRQLVLRTLLTYLELDGYLEAGTPFYANYQFKPHVSSAEILGRFDGERRQFLSRLLQQSKKARAWFHIDLEAASRHLGAPRDRLVRALDYLAEIDLMTVKAAGVHHTYRKLRTPEDLDALGQDLHRRALELERREVQRLDQVVELMTLAACRTNRLSEYFGEPREQPCGHCSWCLEGEAPPLPPAHGSTLDDQSWRQVEAVRQEHAEVLADPRALARFLAGLTSPYLSKRKLTSHAMFGRYGEVPFSQLLARAGSDFVGPEGEQPEGPGSGG